MKALSVRAPWWWYILNGGKDIENRPRRTHFRGTIYIHASQYWGPNIIPSLHQAQNIFGSDGSDDMKFLLSIRDWSGYIVGRVDIVDCVSESPSPWYEGPEIGGKPNYGWVLENPKPFKNPRRKIKGMLGLFEV